MEYKERRCLKCGETDPEKFYPKQKSECKKCALERAKSKYHNLSPEERQEYIRKAGVHFKDWVPKNLIRYRVLAAKHRALVLGKEFAITTAIMQKKLEEQQYKCFISGVPLSMDAHSWHVLSIDRLDSSKGYTPENSILVTRFVNVAKNDQPLEEFIKLIKEVYNNLNK